MNEENGNYNFNVEGLDHLDEPPQILDLSEHDRRRLENEILFCTQGVGNIKNVGGFDVYVKNEHCEESIRDLIKNIKNDNPRIPAVKQTLGNWNFL